LNHETWIYEILIHLTYIYMSKKFLANQRNIYTFECTKHVDSNEFEPLFLGKHGGVIVLKCVIFCNK